MRPDPLRYLQLALDEHDNQDWARPLHVIGGEQRARACVDNREVVNLASNNYLGLTTHPRLRAAAIQAIEDLGVGAASVRPIAGTMALHVELERRLAAFKETEAALVFQSGFTANAGTVAAILGRDDVVISDELNHASIIDGARLSRATIKVFPHRKVDAARKILKELPAAQRKLIITDGVFSMDGDLAPLPALCDLAEQFGAIMMVDDAHASGVFGRNGRGTVDHFGLHGRVDVQVGTLSKAFGVMGGVVAGSKRVMDYLRQKARPFLFSSAVTPADVAACIAAVDVLEESTELVDRLWENAKYFKDGMKKQGFNTGLSTTPITPVMLGEAPLAQQFSRELFDEGVFAMALGFPTVPQGKARIRVMISAAHSREDLDKGLEAFAKVGRKLGVIG